MVTKKEAWSSRKTKNKNKKQGLKYDITIERKFNSSAHSKGGFIIHWHPRGAMTLDTDKAVPSLEDKFNASIVLIYS